jgi:hypothetical protein
MIKRASEYNLSYTNSLNPSVNQFNTMKLNKTNLNERIEKLTDGDLVEDVFNSLEIFKLSEVSFDDLYKVLGQEDASYLWNLLVQHNVYVETEEYPQLADVKEFSWYGDNLTASEGAIEYLQANNISKDQQAILWLKREMEVA